MPRHPPRVILSIVELGYVSVVYQSCQGTFLDSGATPEQFLQPLEL